MTPHPRDRNLEDDLSEQLQFLASSNLAFDQGNLAEAKRIAIVIRVLVHDTAVSHSLLAQLGIKDGLEWADSAPVIDRDPNIVARSPGLTTMGFDEGGVTFRGRHSSQIEQSSTTRFVTFDEWWERPVILDSNDAEFSRKELVLQLVNKDGGAHIDRLNEKTHALVHSNSAGFVRIEVPGGVEAEPMPTPIYASVRTVAEELLLTLRRSGRQVPESAIGPHLGIIEMFQSGDNPPGPSLVLDKLRDDVSLVSFKFDSLPGVTFEIARLRLAQTEPALDGEFPAGWLEFVGVSDISGAVVSQSGMAGPTEESLTPAPPVDISTPANSLEAVAFAFENFPQATFVAIRSPDRLEMVDPWGWQHVRQAGWIDLFVTVDGATRQIGGFAGPTSG